MFPHLFAMKWWDQIHDLHLLNVKFYASFFHSPLSPSLRGSLALLCFLPLVQSVSSVAQSCPTLCNPMNCSTPGLPVHHQLPSLPKLMSIELVMPSNHLILCHPLLLLPSIFPNIRIFSDESALYIRWPKYWSFSFNTSVLPMNTQDWFPLGWTCWIFLQSKGLSRVFSNTRVQNHQFFCTQLSL